MASKKMAKPSAFSESSKSQTTELQEKVKKLQAELDAERTRVKQLRREKTLECRQIREHEQNNARIALKDLKAKFNTAKQRELEIQKDTLNRRYETEVVKLRKQKDGEIAKLRSNLRKCQNELTEAIHCLANSAQHHGLSGAARASGTFESERAKLLAEVTELNSSKRHLEDVVKTLTDTERHKTHTIKTLQDKLKTDVEKTKKEADIEAIRLLDELKSKDRQILQLEKDVSVRDGQITKLRHESEATMEQTKRNNELMRRLATRGLSRKADSLSSLDSSSSDSGADVNGPPTENEQQTQLHDQIRNLQEQNQQLTYKLDELEDKHKPLHEKARKFLEKNMEQTALNRDLEDKIKLLNESNKNLKSEIDILSANNKRLSVELQKDKAGKTQVQELETRLEELSVELGDQQEVVLALQHACAEKDRRLELLSHRRRKQRNSRSQHKVVRFMLPDEEEILAAGIKETYFGYDEDRASVDSEGSSKISLDVTPDDDAFDEITRDEYAKNYQRLAREHLELERSYALLQNQSAFTPTDQPQEIAWTDDEKLGLEITVEDLQNKLTDTDSKLTVTSAKLKESQEQQEDLEFQLLELREVHDKLLQESEETKSELSFRLEETDTSEHQPGALESKNEEMRKKIHKLQRSASKDATTEERALLLQAKVLLDVSEKKIKELTTNEDTLNAKVKKLEEERVSLLSQSTGEPEKLVLEYEQVRNELHSVKQENDKLKETNVILESQNQDFDNQLQDWALVSKMDSPQKVFGERPVSELLEEEIKALKYGETQLAEQNTKLTKELEKVQKELDNTRDELILANLGLTQASEVRKENARLSDELDIARAELQVTRDNLSAASVDSSLQARTTRLSLDEDLVTDNQLLRAEIFSLQEQLKAFESESTATVHLQRGSNDVTSPEHRIRVLEKEIADLKHHNEQLKDKMKEKDKDVMRSREVVVSIETDLVDLEKENSELRDKVDDLETEDDNEVAALRVKVRALERSARMLQEQLESTDGDVTTSIEDVVEELEQEKDKVAELRKHMDRMSADLVQLDALKEQVSELETGRRELQEKQDKLRSLQNSDEIEPTNVALQSAIRDSGSSEDDQGYSSIGDIKSQNKMLQTRIKELETKLVEFERSAEEKGETATSDKDKRIEVLENELARIQANEGTLNDTIEELREVENALRSQVSKHEDSSASDSDRSEDKIESLHLELTKLHDTNSGLLSQIAEMTESERSLREQLSNTEDSYKAQLSQLRDKLAKSDAGDSSEDESDRPSADESGDKKSNKSRLAQLEARVRELSDQESKLLEKVYAMKLENQELQEQIDTMEESMDSPRSGEGESKDDLIADLKANIVGLEAEKSKLKDDLVKAKLDAVETLKETQELKIDAAQLKAMQDQINELEKSKAAMEKVVKELESKIEDLEGSESSLKVEIIRLREFEAKAKEHEVCEGKLKEAAKQFQGQEREIETLEKELNELREERTNLEKETLVVAESVVPWGSERKDSISDDEQLEKKLEQTSKVRELEDEIEKLKENEKLVEELKTSEETLKSEIERLKRFEEVYSTERVESELVDEDQEGRINLRGNTTAATERIDTELDDAKEEQVHVSVERETVLAAVNVGIVDRAKRRSPRGSESDGEDNQGLRDKIYDLEKQLEEIPELRAQLDQMKENNELLLENMTKMKLHIDEQVAEERDLHEQLRKRKNLQAQLQEMEAQLVAQNEQLMAYHKAVEAEKGKLKQEKDDLKKKLDLMEDWKEEMEGERDELKASLVMAKEETNETIAKFEKFSLDFETMRNERDQHKGEKEELKSQMKDVNELVTLSDELRAQNISLQNEFDNLKLKHDDTVIEKETVEKSEKELKKAAEELKEKCHGLEEQLEAKAGTEVKLFEKIEVLVESEGRLMEKLEEAEEEEDILKEEVEKLKEENQQLKTKGLSAEAAGKEVEEKIEQLEKKERDLKENLKVIEAKKEELESRLEDSNKTENQELVKLREKVDILLDTEEKLMDRLQEQEEVEAKLKEKINSLEENERELRVQLVTLKEKEEEARSRSSSKSSADTDSSQDQVKELEQNEKLLKQRVNELEKSETTLSTQLQGMEKTVETLANSETELRNRLADIEQDKMVLQLKYNEIGKMEIALHTKVKDLEEENKKLQEAMEERSSHPKDDSFATSIQEEIIRPQSAVTIAAAPPGSKTLEERLLGSNPEVEHLKNLNREDLIDRLHDSEKMEETQREKIRDLTENLSRLRRAVEGVTGPVQTDDNANTDELELDARILEIVNSEALLNEKVKDLEHKEGALRERLQEAEDMLDRVRRDRKNEVEELELELDEVKKNEARLKNRLQNSDDFTEERDSGLESFSMLDSPEAILKQRIHEFERMEEHLKQQIVELEKDREELHEITRHDKNHIHELSVQNKEYEFSDKNLKDQINRLEASETQLQIQVDNLTDKIEELEEQIKNMKIAEKQLRGALIRTENQESELTVQLENAQGDVEHTENKWKKKVADVDREKVNLANRVEDLTLRVSDLEGSELILKRKLKTATESDEAHKEQAAKLEESESSALIRIQELEDANEALSQKVHKLEEDKASLLYELSDLETTHIDGYDTVHKLKNSQKKLLEDIANREDAGFLLQRKLKEYMQRENELEDEVDKFQTQERQWNEKKDKMEVKVNAYSAKVRELEALVALNETKVSFVNDLEKENGILHRNLAHQQKTIEQSDQEIHKLQDRIMQYEYSSANNALATIPKDEVSDLRNKAKQLQNAEEQIEKLEKLEQHLRQCIEDLRQGKDAHGYELEIAEMKEKVDKYNQVVQDRGGLQWALTSTKKAHELLKENHDHTKKELKVLREQVQKDVNVGETTRPESVSKGILARLTPSFTLAEITPELKQALKQLENNHPEAYQEFIRTLHPSAGSVAVVKPQQDDEVQMKFSEDEGPVIEEQIQPVQTVSVSQSKPSEESKRQGTKHYVYGRVADGHTEETVWSSIEAPSSRRPDSPTGEEPLWTNVENTADDVTLTMFLGGEDVKKRTSSLLSASSGGSSSGPPALPDTIPPELSMRRLESPGNESSYYLPSAHESPISADETSEMDDLDLAVLRGKSPPRAVSVDRDSVISESLLSSSHSKRMNSSMDSIPDSGMGTLHQSDREILTERIQHLEKQLKNKEKELNLAQINRRELDTSETSQTIVELQDKIQKLQENLKLKEAQLDALHSASREQGQMNTSELQSNITSLTLQLEQKEKEIEAQNVNISSLTQELNKWQGDVTVLRKEKTLVEEALTEAQNKVDENKELQDKYSELQTDYIDLQKECNALEDQKNTPIESNDTEKLEISRKLEDQLANVKKTELEKQQLESQLKAVERILQDAKHREDEVVKDNVTLRQKVDLLSRDNNTLQTAYTEYNKIKSKYVAMEKSKIQAENLVTPLRARVVRLSKSCKEKDNLIEKLASEVRQVDKKSIVVTEAKEMLSKSASEEYNRPLTPLNVPNSDEDELILSDLPPLVSASVTHSVRDAPNDADATGSGENPKTSAGQIDTLIEQKITNGTQVAPPSMSNGSAHVSVEPVTIDDLVISQASLAPVPSYTEEGAHTLPKDKKRSKGEATLITRSAASTDRYRAVKDYQPEHFSRSGHKRLELPLQEGDIVKVLGSTDDKGYFEAELDGKVGLVPANYLQPVYPTRPQRPRSDIYGDEAPEQILKMHAGLQRAHVPLHRVAQGAFDDLPPGVGLRSGSNSARSSTRGGGSITHPMFLGAPVIPVNRRARATRKAQQPSRGYIVHPGHYNQVNVNGGHTLQIASSMPQLPTSSSGQIGSASVTGGEATLHAPAPVGRLSGVPAAPVGLQVLRVVGRHSLLLAWKVPLMDELARCSNGVQVRGYRLHIDGRDKQDLPSPHLTKALVEHLNLHKPHNFTIQTVSMSGVLSTPVGTMYEGPGRYHGEDEGDSAGDGDVSSIMSAGTTGDRNAEKRVFMAVYSYNPQQQSPQPDTSNELPLSAGDIITTFGPARPDGFYHARVRGRKGLVPANFIEEIALFRTGSHRSLMSGAGAPVSHPMSTPHNRASTGGATKQSKLRS